MPEPVITLSEDAALVTGLVRRAWAGTVDPRSSGHRLTEDGTRRLLADGVLAFVARDGDRPVGCVLLEPEGSTATLMKLAVPDGRRQGIATALIEAAVAEARARGAEKVVLAVSQLQARLTRYYARRGFVVAPGARYRQSAPGSFDPIVMERSLRPVSRSTIRSPMRWPRCGPAGSWSFRPRPCTASAPWPMIRSPSARVRDQGTARRPSPDRAPRRGRRPRRVGRRRPRRRPPPRRPAVARTAHARAAQGPVGPDGGHRRARDRRRARAVASRRARRARPPARGSGGGRALGQTASAA